MTLFLFVLLCVNFVFLIGCVCKRADIKCDLELSQHQNELLKDKIKSLEYENELLKSYRNSIKNHTYSKSKIDELKEEVKEAVRYAMKKSHHDNGGSAKDFDKFRKLYNSMK